MGEAPGAARAASPAARLVGQVTSVKPLSAEKLNLGDFGSGALRRGVGKADKNNIKTPQPGISRWATA